jgi:hypothetical protein
MKKIFSIALIIGLLLIHLLSFSQPPPPPDNPILNGENAPVGGGAPVGNGNLILVGLAAAYAVRKIYVLRCKSICRGRFV